MKIIYITLLIFLLNITILANAKNYPIVFSNISPQIDGLITEDAWNIAEWSGNFSQFEPNAGANPSEQTEFKIFHDENFIYVAIRCFDNNPSLIAKRMSRRDGWEGDIVGIAFDSYYDKSTAFLFSVSASGIKNDLVYSNDGNSEDPSWDPVWYVKTNIDSLGWTAEMKIPLNQLRYNETSTTWGLNLIRVIYRYNETSTWQSIDPNKSGLISQFGNLTGMNNLSTKKHIEILPYFMSGYKNYLPQTGNPFADGSDMIFNAGIDGKISITNDFMLDFTINPDFGQVEADPSSVNLSAFETYFSEKRPFFIENKNITNYSFGWNIEDLFYSRRIGRYPQNYPDVNDDEFVKMPNNTRMLGALKFSGKSKNGWSIGIIESLTKREFAHIYQTDGTIRKESVEPLTNYFVTRVQKDINKGNTQIGGIITSTYRDIQNPNLLFLNKTATTAGIDFKQYFNQRKFFVSGKAIVSNISGSTEAILYQQTAPQRYFQRPDANYLSVDSNLTSLSGSYAFFTFGKEGIKGVRYSASFYYASPSFEVNDMGYLRNVDYLTDIFWIGYTLPESKGIINQFNINFAQWAAVDNGFGYKFFGYNANSWMQFKNLWSFWWYFENNFESNSYEYLRGGPELKMPATLQGNIGFSTKSSSKLVFELGSSFKKDLNNHSQYIWISPEITYRPIDIFSVNLDFSYSKNYNNLQYIDQVNFDNQTSYILASINQNTINFTFRMDLNITPDLTLQYYGSPFISSALFSDYKHITNSTADNYNNRFQIYPNNILDYNNYTLDFNQDGIVDYDIGLQDFNFRQFRSNLVLRWEYIPGSTLFVVWSHEQTDFLNISEFNLANDIINLFTIYPTDVFLIKLQHRFS
ncbi:MAG: carbohydrate binding family 9 domain-containing protein [Bacteroidales bacterium]|nr:carbohydrate binding family 9 domain-containing protein [Bacteroidales bacterium]